MGQVINVKKVKNEIAIKKIGDHNLRQQISDNVDAEKSDQNFYLIGSANMNVVQEVQSKLEGIKYRKDANKVINLVFSASHEEMAKIDPIAWSKEITEFCEKKFGKENILYSVLHRDELTPHLHISFVPIVDKKLRSNVYFDGLRKFRDFVKKFMKSTKNMGLKKTTQKRRQKLKLLQNIIKRFVSTKLLTKKLIKNLNNSKSCLKFHLIPKN